MWIKLLLLVFVFSFLFRTDFSFDQDLGRHIKNGEVILNNFSLINSNLYSYTNPDFKFINTHWGFGVIAFVFYSTIGIYWLLILKIIIFLTSIWIILSIPNINPLLLPIGFIFFHTLRERTELRPEILSFLFTSLTFYILNRFENTKTKLIFTLPLIQLLWINIHIYFFVGLILQLIFIVSLFIRKEKSKLKSLTTIFGLSVIFSLLNPNLINGLLYPLNINQNYGYTIVENQTIFMLESLGFNNRNFIFAKTAAIIIFISLIFAFFKKSLSIKNTLIALLGLILAFWHVRSLPYLVFLSLPAVLSNFEKITPNFWTKLLNIFFGGLLIVESFLYLNGSYYKYTDNAYSPKLDIAQSGRGALDFVKANNLKGPVYNNFDIGSYIIFRLYPLERVFIDGRPEAYPKEFIQNIYIPGQSDRVKFKEQEKQYSFNTIIFSHTDQTPWGKALLTNLLKDSEWKLVYIDDFMIVLTKPDSNLPHVDLSKLQPNNYNFDNHLSYLRLSIFLLNNGYSTSGLEFAKEGYKKFNDSPTANLILSKTITNFLQPNPYIQKTANFYWW